MKKLMFLIVFILSISTINYAQEVKKDLPLANDPTAMQVVDKVFDKTTETIQGLAQALKVPAEKVFSILVKQQVVNAITWIIVDIISLTILLIFLVKIWKWALKANDDSEGFSYLLAIILTGVPLIIVFASLKTVVMGFVNPEYGAIKEILTALGG